MQAKYPKKQYELETRSNAGDPLNVPLLGMPAGSEWVLDAPYGDKSLLRNVLAYKLADDMGWYAGRTQFCELVVNGQYMGIYVFTEKICPDQNRLNIESLTTDDDDLTGGYIIRMDELTGDIAGGWYSDFPADNGEQIYYQYHYPSQAAITSEQKAYIQSYVFQFENAMKGTDLTDPETGYPGFINTDSYADFVILNEIGKNVNGYRLNSFMYKDSELGSGELTMGPVWGFELAFGNADFYDGASAEGWQIDFSCAECLNDENQLPFWWKALFEDPDFKNVLRYRWKFLRESILNAENMNAFIDETAGRLEEARARNFEQWPVLGKYVWPNPFIGETYEDETDYLKQWIADRSRWIDGQWEITPGDMNGDDHTDLYDLILALQVCSGITPSSTVWKGADISGDGKIGVEEAVFILQKISGIL